HTVMLNVHAYGRLGICMHKEIAANDEERKKIWDLYLAHNLKKFVHVACHYRVVRYILCHEKGYLYRMILNDVSIEIMQCCLLAAILGYKYSSECPSELNDHLSTHSITDMANMVNGHVKGTSLHILVLATQWWSIFFFYIFLAHFRLCIDVNFDYILLIVVGRVVKIPWTKILQIL
ncbi:hypothetical protein ACJX0J_024698, partial [Zea mays]